jgi:hypothetical protein
LDGRSALQALGVLTEFKILYIITPLHQRPFFAMVRRFRTALALPSIGIAISASPRAGLQPVGYGRVEDMLSG